MPRVDPAKLEAVKTLATAIGVREAARQTGIPESTVQSWSARYQWFTPPKLPPTISNPRNATIATKKPSDALADTLRDESRQTKLNLSRGILRASRAIAEADPRELLEKADKVKAMAGAGSVVHSWEEKQTNVGLNLSILSVSGDMTIQVGQGSPADRSQVVEGEIVEE